VYFFPNKLYYHFYYKRKKGWVEGRKEKKERDRERQREREREREGKNDRKRKNEY
jgi:hypothetical protein